MKEGGVINENEIVLPVSGSHVVAAGIGGKENKIMIREVDMYQCVCDGCGKSHVDDFNGYVAWSDETMAAEAAYESGWTNIEGKDYCPDCYVYDEELDEYTPKKKL